MTHESVIITLRVNEVTDRETFVNMFDSETALKDGASDLGFDLVTGGLPHKREFARVVSAWKTAKVMAETKLQIDTVARAHCVSVTLQPATGPLFSLSLRSCSDPMSPMTAYPRSQCLNVSQKNSRMVLLRQNRCLM